MSRCGAVKLTEGRQIYRGPGGKRGREQSRSGGGSGGFGLVRTNPPSLPYGTELSNLLPGTSSGASPIRTIP